MKRDWDLVRTILIKLEENPTDMPLTCGNFSGHDSSLVAYHMEIMSEAGLIDARVQHSSCGGEIHGFATRLTWHGHEFLDSIRADTVWNKVKQTAVEKGVDLTFDLVSSLAGQALRSLMGLPPA